MALLKRKRTTRNRRRTRRRVRATIARTPRLIGNGVHHYKRMFSGSANGVSIIAGNAVHNPYVGAFGVTLGQVVNSSDFANLYDQYKINYVVVKWFMRRSIDAQSATGAVVPRMYWYRDYDDAGTPSSIDEFRENSKTRSALLLENRPITWKFKPNVLGVVFQSAIASQYAPKFGQWLDMSNTSTPHYGMKFAIDDLRNTNYSVECEVTLYFSCRQPR